MKTLYIRAAIILSTIALFFAACSSDDANAYIDPSRQFVRINETIINTYLGDKDTITAQTDSVANTDTDLQWNVMDEGIATITPIGGHKAVVVPIAEGMTIVKVSIPGKELSYFAELNVLPAAAKPFTLTEPVAIKMGPVPVPTFNTLADLNGAIDNLTDVTGTSTKMGIRVVEGFSTYHNLSHVTRFANTLGIPAQVMYERFWADGKKESGVYRERGLFQIDGMNPKQSYTLVFYLTVDIDTQTQTAYKVSGGNGEKTENLMTMWNTKNLAIVRSVTPRADGTMDIEMKPGPDNLFEWKYFGVSGIWIFPDGYDIGSFFTP